jgi:Leucine-rich repeat (LRR) protein
MTTPALNSTHITDLPIESLFHILEYATPESRSALSSSCKAFHDAETMCFTRASFPLQLPKDDATAESFESTANHLWQRKMTGTHTYNAPLRELSLFSIRNGVKRQSIFTDLCGLNRLTSLTRLVCNKLHLVDDITPISALTNLRDLSCEGMKGIVDITPVIGLTDLTRLNCASMSGVQCLQPLTRLTRLTHLECGWMNGVTDISPLTCLSRLLFLECNTMKNVHNITSALEHLTCLTHLNCIHLC